MKNLKKAIALLLALAMVLCLSACGSFEKKMAKSAAKMSQLDSMHMDMDMEVSFGLSLMGQSVDTEMTMEMAMDINTEPLAVKMDIDIGAMGMKQSLQAYVISENGTRRTYVSDDAGATWQQGKLDDDGIGASNVSVKDSLELLSKWAESFAEDGEEKINGSAAAKYTGVITAENLREAMELTGAADAIESSLDMELDTDLDGMGSIPVSVWIDKKSGMVVRMDMDMTEMMQGIMTEIMDEAVSQSMEEAGLSDIPVEVDISEAKISMEYSQFDNVPAIELPAGIK